MIQNHYHGPVETRAKAESPRATIDIQRQWLGYPNSVIALSPIVYVVSSVMQMLCAHYLHRLAVVVHAREHWKIFQR